MNNTDPLKLARDIRKRLHLIPEPVERLKKIDELAVKAMRDYRETPNCWFQRLQEIHRLAQEKPALADPSVRLDMEACCDAIERQQEKVAGLFDAIAHGDDKHREWLKAKIDEHFAAALR